MRRQLYLFLLATALISPAVISGCSGHVRVYDAEYRDYHYWDHDEDVYYRRWEGDTHREHRDFDRRSDAERREYWQWRHHHEDH